MKRLNRNAKLAFFTARKRSGDAQRISDATGYSYSHVTGVVNGSRSVNQVIANKMYTMTARREKNSNLIWA